MRLIFYGVLDFKNLSLNFGVDKFLSFEIGVEIVIYSTSVCYLMSPFRQSLYIYVNAFTKTSYYLSSISS